jgi:hypothetical protein
MYADFRNFSQAAKMFFLGLCFMCLKCSLAIFMTSGVFTPWALIFSLKKRWNEFFVLAEERCFSFLRISAIILSIGRSSFGIGGIITDVF